MIKVTALYKQYGTNEVLHDVNLEFTCGKVYGIVGENGAGKTTLFRCMAGLEAHQGIVTADHSPLKNHLGLLLTEPFFFSRITGEEYLRLMCQARGVALEDVATRNIFDLPLQQYASTYSTGMKKKLALMAILLQKNKYFILDEPFNGVDIQSNLVLTGIIHKLRDMGKVVILSSHIFSTLRDSCDEILLLHKNEPIKRVLPHEYEALEATMKAVLIGDRIDRLGIG